MAIAELRVTECGRSNISIRVPVLEVSEVPEGTGGSIVPPPVPDDASELIYALSSIQMKVYTCVDRSRLHRHKQNSVCNKGFLPPDGQETDIVSSCRSVQKILDKDFQLIKSQMVYPPTYVIDGVRHKALIDEYADIFVRGAPILTK